MRRVVLRLVVSLFFAVLCTAGAVLWLQVRYAAPGPHTDERVVIVERGTAVADIARQLEGAGIVDSAFVFRAAGRVSGIDVRLKAGEYAIPAHASARDVAAILASGQTVVRRLTVVEGTTTADILRQVAATDGLTGEVTTQPDEGALLPETYHYSYGDSRDGLVRRMAEAMTATLGRLWSGRRDGLPLDNPRQALILASIVEKETGRSVERPLVAAVFFNRLGKGMRLQSDPTVAYGIVAGGGALELPLNRAALQSASPYNTYMVNGLPPGPICNPGMAAIAATLQPSDTNHLYFVADGTGGHAFARTLQKHNRNVRAWRRLQTDSKGSGPTEPLPAP